MISFCVEDDGISQPSFPKIGSAPIVYRSQFAALVAIDCIELCPIQPRQSFGNSGMQEGWQRDWACPCTLSV
jgi:hypothetical protein